MSENKLTKALRAIGDFLMPGPIYDNRESRDRETGDITPWYLRQPDERSQRRSDGSLSGAQMHLPDDDNYSHRYYGDRWGSPDTGARERFYRPPQAPEADEPFKTHLFHPRAELLMRTPRVLITPEAFKRMCLYVEIGALEVGWLGTVTRTANGDFLIGTTYLLKQDVSPTETILSVDGINDLSMQLVEQGEEGLKALSNLRFWGHSHVRMGTSASGTDEMTMERFGTEGHEWYVRGIFNKRGRAEFTIYLFERGVRINDAPWDVWDPVKSQVIPTRKRFSPVVAVTTFLDSLLAAPAPQQENKPAVAPPEPKPDATPAGDKPTEAEGGTAEQKPAAPPPPPKLELPPELVPSAELRAEVQAEFKAKVKERIPLFGWTLFGGDKKDPGPTEPSTTGGAAPGETNPTPPSSGEESNARPRRLSLKERIEQRRQQTRGPADKDQDKK